MWARRRPRATSSSGTSGIEEMTMTVAQRRTVRTPSRFSASWTDETVRGNAKNAELT